MGESSAHKQARQQELANAQLQQQIEQQNLARQNAIYGQISPFATGLLNMGSQAQQGIAPASFQLGTRNALAGAFGQQRQNLADFLGSSGQGFSGLAAGPAANLGTQESTAMGQAYADAVNQALGLGLQGSNVLQGQQGVFNPTTYAGLAGQGFQNNVQNTPMSGFWGNLGSSLAGAAISSIPFGKIYGGGGSSSVSPFVGF